MFLLNIGDSLLTGTITAAIGISMVFLLLFVLIGVIYLMSKLNQIQRNQGNTTPVAVSETSSVPTEEYVDDKLVIAAITAAVMLMLADENNENVFADFRVRTIKKI